MTTNIRLEKVSLNLAGKPIVHGVELTIRAGELTVVIGPNGAGKSTLLKLIAGDYKASKGIVYFDGTRLEEWAVEALAQRRAVMPQSGDIAFPFTVLEVVRMGSMAYRCNQQLANERALMALAQVDMEAFADRSFQALSGGEQQRVQLARTLCQVWSPIKDGASNFLLLDEPISNLDIRHQIEILRLSKRYAMKGGGCLAVLHDLNIAAMFADRLLVMKAGQLVSDGTPKETLTDQLMVETFGVPLKVNHQPKGSIPYILPQSYFHTNAATAK